MATNTPFTLAPTTLPPQLTKINQTSHSPASQQFISAGRSPSYTYYHPTLTQSAVNLHNLKQYERKEYRYVSQSFSTNNLIANKAELNPTQKQEQKSDMSEKNYQYKTISRQVVDTPQPKAREQYAYYSANPIVNTSFFVEKQLQNGSKIEVKKISNYKQKQHMSNTNMIESIVMEQRQCDSDTKLKSKSNQSSQRGYMQNKQFLQQNGGTTKPKINQFELTDQVAVKKCEQDEQLQNRVFNMAQELLTNQSLIRSHQHKIELLSRQKNQLSQKYKKSQQSLKISRNIIVTLNQKIARTLSQTQISLKSTHQYHQSQILNTNLIHQQTVKRLQSTIFQLKLKLIDQTNAMQEALTKAQKQRQHIMNEFQAIRNAKQLGQSQVRRVNAVVVNLQNDLIRLDHQNMRMDHQISRLLQTNAEYNQLQISNNKLRQQNQELIRQIQQVSAFLKQLQLQNMQLKHQHAESFALQTQRANQLAKLNNQFQIAQSQFLTNLAKSQAHNKLLRDALQQQKLQTIRIERQRQSLFRQLQQKQRQIVQLNITQDKLMQNLLISQNAIIKQNMLLDQIANLKTKIDSSKIERDSMKIERDSIKNERDSMKNQIDSMKIERDSMKNHIDSMKNQIDSMKNEIASMKIDRDSMKIKIDSMKNEIDLMNIGIASMKNEIELLKAQNQQKQMMVVQKTHIQTNLAQQLNRKEQQLNDCKDKLRKQDQQLIRMAKQCEQFKPSEYLQNPAKLWQTNYKYIKLQKFQLEQWKNNYSQLKRQYSQTKQQIADQQVQNADQKVQISNLINSLQQNTSLIDKLRIQLKEKIHQAENIENTKNNQINTFHEIHQQIVHENNQQIQLLRQKLEQSQKYIKRLTNQASQLKQQILNLQQAQLNRTQLQTIKHTQLQTTNTQLTQQLKQLHLIYDQNIAKQTQAIELLNIQIAQLQTHAICQRQSDQLLLRQNTQAKQIANQYTQENTALELQLQHANQIIEQQKITIEQLTHQLEMQQKDYRTMVEGQINKLTMLYSQQIRSSNELDSPLRPKSRSLKLNPQQFILPNSLEVSPRLSQSCSYEELNRSQLIAKVHELQLMNRSLQTKVQEICSMEQSLNDMIINKIKTFEGNLQRNEQEKQELELRVGQLTEELQMVTEKCRNYEEKIEWIDVMYKEVESNLTDTIEELIRVQALYCNLKFEVQHQNEIKNEMSQAKQQQKDSCSVEIRQSNLLVNSQNNLQEKIGIDSGEEQPVNNRQSEQKEESKQNCNIMEEIDPLQDYDFADYDLEPNQYNYYVKQTKYGDKLYQIKISNVQSDSDQELQNQQKFDENYQMLQQWAQQYEQFDERMCKRECAKEQMQEEDQYLTSNFMMRTIQGLQQKEVGKANPMQEYIMKIIKNIQQNQSKNINAGSQCQEQQKYQCELAEDINSKQPDQSNQLMQDEQKP